MRVFAIVVAYHPDTARLSLLCRTLENSGARVVIVDNTESGTGATSELIDACTQIRLADNTGIAHAQNLGIAHALDRDAEVIVFFDQDSEPDESFLGRLLAGIAPGQPGVVAPVCIDKETGQELPSFRLNRLGWRSKVFSREAGSPYPVDLVIASGSAATAVTFPLVGKMDEDFFIDFVDFEWCLRCRDRQVPVRVVPGAIMRHSLGERTVDFGLIGSPVHGAMRTYYKIRNSFLLFRKPAVPLLYAISSTFFGIIRFFLVLPGLENRAAYMRVFVAAVRDGLNGVGGRNPSPAVQGVASNG